MFILKLAIVICAIYMAITLLLLVGGLVIAPWKGVVGYNTISALGHFCLG